MKSIKKPKYKIGEEIFANWAGGHTTKHIITGIKNTERGFWYTWENTDNSNFGNGLHEHYLSKVYNT